MPENIYKKPTSKVIDVYCGKETKSLVQSALQNTFASDGIKITPAKVRRFLRMLTKPSLGGEAVVIIEKLPLNSMQAHGKFGDKIFARVEKTGNQYVKPYKKPKNPRTLKQQTQRAKIPDALAAWRALSSAQKAVWDKKARNKPKSGYNLFTSNYLKHH